VRYGNAEPDTGAQHSLAFQDGTQDIIVPGTGPIRQTPSQRRNRRVTITCRQRYYDPVRREELAQEHEPTWQGIGQT
jgi:hypothetical protein